MKCPSCTTPDLAMADRQGIEVEYCPQCRGVWLDRGELDKLIQGTTRDEARHDRASRDREAAPGRRRRSMLRDFFDFD